MDYAKCNFLASAAYIWYVSIDKKRTSVSRNFGAKEIRAYLNDKLFFNGRGEKVRTPGPMVPNHVRYQTALHPAEILLIYYNFLIRFLQVEINHIFLIYLLLL